MHTMTIPRTSESSTHGLGDAATNAVKPLILKSLDAAYTQARHFLGNASDAEDAVQEAVLDAMKSANRYDVSRPFGPWMAAHVHHACLRQVRRRGRRQRHESSAGVEMARNAAREGGTDVSDVIRSDVADLPENDRAALSLHYFAGLGQKDAAAGLGISENAFGVRIHRARERLRSLLTRRGLALSGAAIMSALVPSPVHAAPPDLFRAISDTHVPPVRRTATSTYVVTIASCVALCIACAVSIHRPREAPHAAVDPNPQPVGGPWQPPSRDALLWLDPQAGFQLAADMHELRRLASHADLVSVVHDPRAAGAIAEMRKRIASASDQGNELASLLMSPIEAQSLALSIAANGEQTLSDDRRFHAAAVGSLWGNRLASLLGTLDAGPQLPAFGPFTSLQKISDSGAVSASTPDRALTVMGDMQFMRQRLAAAPAFAPKPEQLNSAIWCRAELGPLLQAYSVLSQRSSVTLAEYDTWLGSGWMRWRPILNVACTIDEASWKADGALTGASACSPFLALALIPRSTIPAWCEAVLRCPLRIPAGSLIPPAGKDTLATAYWGMSFDGLVVPDQDNDPAAGMISSLIPLLTGDFFVEVGDGTPVPRTSIIMGRLSGAGMGPFHDLMALLGAHAATHREGIEEAFDCDSPIGPVHFAVTSDRIVATTNAVDIPRYVSQGTRKVMDHLTIDADLKKAAREWGAYLQQGIDEIDIPLANSPIGMVASYGTDSIRSARTGGTAAVLPLLPPYWRKFLEAGKLALYGRDSGKNQDAFRWIWREGEAFHVTDERDALGSGQMTAAQAHEALAGWKVMAGPSLDKLTAIPSHEPITKACIPPLASLVDSVSTYHLSWSCTQDGATFHERGLPIVSAFGAWAAGYISSSANPQSDIQQTMHHASIVKAFADLRGEISALEPIADRLSAHVPDDAASIPGIAGALAPLFGGRTPTDEEIKALGVWYGKNGKFMAATALTETPGASRKVSTVIGSAVWTIPRGDGIALVVFPGRVCLSITSPEERLKNF